MKKGIIGLIMAIGAISAFAADEDLIVDGKLIRVTEVNSYDRVLHTQDIPNGIFILTSAGVIGAQDNLPNAAAIIRDTLVKHGIKVADKAEDASIAVTFNMGGSATLVAANNKAEHSNLPNSGKLITSTGAIAAGVATGGVFAAVGYLAGALIPSDEKTSLSTFMIDKPVVREVGLFSKHPRVVPTVDSREAYSINDVQVQYRLEKDKEAQDDAILKMMVEKWVKHCVVIDAAPTAALPASSPAPALSVAETAEKK